ncbi:hypothetical protein IEQ34_019488 [Dendrobium chrysotoxum]|uniref:Uncharacterized protein n=1 Tax=Dendrobium chrysotoxum TaxID=161865 RepID=A0AAV7FRK2_DENCH|nr:hypothetical protein IEQ34_019488 [Dendrobium chrysotoxum]
MDRMNASSPSVGENRNQNMFLNTKRTRIETKLPFTSSKEFPIRQPRRHHSGQGNHGDLGGDGGDAKRLFAVPEKLVQEREEKTGCRSQNPHPGRYDSSIWVVRDGNGKGDLFNWRVLKLIFSGKERESLAVAKRMVSRHSRWG